MRKPWRWLLLGGIVALGAGFVVTGVSEVPTWLALGPCLKDPTSPVSYRPRVSPLATVDARAGGVAVRLCYGRPAMRGRVVFGDLVPYDSLWRMGANEPTRLYTAGAISLAGLVLPAGRYALYARPHPDRWEVFATRSILHWGNDISPAVRAREVGSITVPVERLAQPVETLTVRVDTSGAPVVLRLDWETTGISLPLLPAPAAP